MAPVGERMKATCIIPDRKGKLKVKKPDSDGKYFLRIRDPVRHIISRKNFKLAIINKPAFKIIIIGSKINILNNLRQWTIKMILERIHPSRMTKKQH